MAGDCLDGATKSELHDEVDKLNLRIDRLLNALRRGQQERFDLERVNNNLARALPRRTR